jgi:hypothetical protein
VHHNWYRISFTFQRKIIMNYLKKNDLKCIKHLDRWKLIECITHGPWQYISIRTACISLHFSILTHINVMLLLPNCFFLNNPTTQRIIQFCIGQ